MAGTVAATSGADVRAAYMAWARSKPQPEGSDLYSLARRYLPNLDEATLRAMDPSELELLVQRAQIREEMDAISARLGAGGIGPGRVRDMVERLQFLGMIAAIIDRILARMREADREMAEMLRRIMLQLQWKASQEKGQAVHHQALAQLGILEKVSGLPSAELKGLVKDTGGDIRREDKAALSRDARTRLLRMAGA